jgi:hypothetical protein
MTCLIRDAVTFASGRSLEIAALNARPTHHNRLRSFHN